MSENQWPNEDEHWMMIDLRKMLKRLEGVQGPEQRLVGDVAERIPQPDDVEERSGESSGVGEIGGAVELLEIIARRICEARIDALTAVVSDTPQEARFFAGKAAVLVDIHAHIADTYSQRSDLSNAPVLATADNKSPTP